MLIKFLFDAFINLDYSCYKLQMIISVGFLTFSRGSPRLASFMWNFCKSNHAFFIQFTSCCFLFPLRSFSSHMPRSVSFIITAVLQRNCLSEIFNSGIFFEPLYYFGETKYELVHLSCALIDREFATVYCSFLEHPEHLAQDPVLLFSL